MKINLICVLLLSSAMSANAEPVCTKRAVNLLKSRGPASPITWRVGPNMPLTRLEKNREWSKVSDLEGEVHYVPNSELSATARCVVVRTNVAALHGAPNSSAPATELRTLDRFTSLKKVNSKQDWVQVEDEAGHQAWIHESQLWKGR